MIHIIKTFTNIGLHGHEITIEADQNKALPTIDIIGLPDAAIKEAKERIRATYRNCGLKLPANKIILNLAPSHIRKEGTRFDVAMAMAILTLINDGNIHHKQKLTDYLFFGELGLDGSVKKISGILPSVISAIKMGYTHFFVPADNLYELAYIQDIFLYPLETFVQLVEHFTWSQSITPLYNHKQIEDIVHVPSENNIDFCHIKWHAFAKRALCIAAAWLHNVLMVGSPWSGKTMLARALHAILPPLGKKEILHVSQIYSLVGKLSQEKPLITHRPFRQVHHTASKISIVGGGRHLTPGEVSLAHKGVLFFDEVPEFPREVLEVLRQPIEDKHINISRVSWTVQYPSNFMFVGTMNPSPCWYYNDPEIPCKSSYAEVKRYQSKVSGPLLDRIDVVIEVPREKLDKILHEQQEETSEQIRQKVLKARHVQQKRYKGTSLVTNAHLSAQNIQHYIPLDDVTKSFLTKAAKKMKLSARVVHRTLKLARTIADIEQQEQVVVTHIAEALQYRNKTMFIE